ncbi:MAG: hypothetical protein AAGK14_12970 [Verrucomicrobiota bacterium]
MKSRPRLSACLLLLLAGYWPLVAEQPSAPRVEVVQAHTLDVIFQGLKVGERSFQPGERYDAVTWTDETVTLRDRNQRFTLPRAKVKPVAAEPPPVAKANPAPSSSSRPAAHPGPAPPQPPKPLPSPAPVVSAPQEAPPDASSVERNLKVLRDYVTQVNAYLGEEPTAVRHARYARERKLDPRSVRPALAALRRLPATSLEPAQRKWLDDLHATLMMYNRGAWTAFERRIRQAADPSSASAAALP